MQIQFVTVDFVVENKIQLRAIKTVGTTAVGKKFWLDFFTPPLHWIYLVFTVGLTRLSSNFASHFRAVFAFHVPESEKDDNEEKLIF